MIEITVFVCLLWSGSVCADIASFRAVAPGGFEVCRAEGQRFVAELVGDGRLTAEQGEAANWRCVAAEGVGT